MVAGCVRVISEGDGGDPLRDPLLEGVVLPRQTLQLLHGLQRGGAAGGDQGPGAGSLPLLPLLLLLSVTAGGSCDGSCSCVQLQLPLLRAQLVPGGGQASEDAADDGPGHPAAGVLAHAGQGVVLLQLLLVAAELLALHRVQYQHSPARAVWAAASVPTTRAWKHKT